MCKAKLCDACRGELPVENQKQVMFDAVKKAIKLTYQQGEPSVANGDCTYRGGNGLKCAVGHLISDSAYQDCLEEKTINNEDVQKAVFSSLNNHLDYGHKELLTKLLRALQFAHDSSSELDLENFSINFVRRLVCNNSQDINLVLSELVKEGVIDEQHTKVN